LSFFAVINGINGVSLFNKATLDDTGEPPFIFHNQYTHRCLLFKVHFTYIIQKIDERNMKII
jgi:hypothetical protein